jgi:hypothetical protein
VTKYYNHESFDGELPGMWTDPTGLVTPTDHLRKLHSEWEETIRGDGGCCPVCGKFGKVYKIKLSQALALALKWIADSGDEDGWVDVQTNGPRWMLRAKTYALLAHWGFIESKNSRSGIWRVKSRGRAFLSGESVAPVAVYIYDNHVKAFDAEGTSFRGCFGVKFDFEELMSSNFNWANVATLEK